MKFTYETQGAITYLVCELDAAEQIDGLTLGMLTNNHIAGFAPVLYTEMNGQRYLKYNISAKVSVDQFFSGTMNKQRALTTFQHILNAMCSADDYMIDLNCFSVRPEHIFLNVSSCETAMICIPVAQEQDIHTELATLFKKILFSTQFDPSEESSYITHMIGYLNTPTFTVYGMADLVNDLLAGKVPQNMGAVPPPAPDAGTLSPFDSTISIDEMPGMLAKKKEEEDKAAVQPEAPASIPVQPPVPAPAPIPVQPPVPAPVPVQPPVPAPAPIPVQPPVPTPVPVPVKLTPSVPVQPPVVPPVQPPVPAPVPIPAKPPVAPPAPPAPPVIKPAPAPAPAKQDPGFAIPGQAPAHNGGFAIPGGAPVPPAPPAKKEKAAPSGEKKSFFGGLLSKKPKVDGKRGKAEQPVPPVPPVVPADGAPSPVPGGFAPAVPPVPTPVPVPVQNSFNETTVLSPAMLGGETTVLSANPAIADPCLIRSKTGEKISINKPVFRIGKEKSYVDYFVGDNTAISRSHANIHTEGGEYFIEDTNSTNHTYLNGKLLTSNVKTKLTSGDKVRLANEDFIFTV